MGKMKSFLDEFMIEVNWKDIAVLKVCMVAFGIMVGASVPKRTRKAARFFGGMVFLGAATLVVMKIFGIDCPACKNFLSSHGFGTNDMDYDQGFEPEFEYDFDNGEEDDDMAEYDFED